MFCDSKINLNDSSEINHMKLCIGPKMKKNILKNSKSDSLIGRLFKRGLLKNSILKMGVI